MFVQHDLPPFLLEGVRDSLGKQKKLLEQLDNGHANEFEFGQNPTTRL
jgi:hypothetical protein